jgi:DNA primase
MPRIPNEVVERLKHEISVRDLAERRGVVFTQSGDNLIGLCPMHDDSQPSLVVSASKNLWHCLGACKAGGSSIDWVMKTEGVSFRHAAELLLVDYPGLGTGAVPVKESTVRKLENPLDPDADDRELLRQVVAFFHATAKATPDVPAYLEGRGLVGADIIDRFTLGYSNRSLGYRLPARDRAAGAHIRGRLQQLGVYRASGHEHFSGCVVVPVFDEAGDVVELYGRKIGETLHKDVARHLYLPGPLRGVWNWEAVAASKEIILCEALIDALTFWYAGYRNVTASYGVEGFTASHWDAFRRYAIERVLIAYDRDAAGDRAALRLAEELRAEGIECYRVEFPHGMDANEYALAVRPAEKSLGVLLRNALWLGSGNKRVPEPEAPGASKAEESAEPEPGPSSPFAAPAVEPIAPEPVTPEPPLASPEPPAPALDIPTQIVGEAVMIRLGDRSYRIRNLAQNLTHGQMRVNVLCARGDALHSDTLDLSPARNRLAFAKEAGAEIGVKPEIIKRDLGRVLFKLEQLQDEQIRRAIEPKDKPVTMSDQEREAAMELLKTPQLLDRILDDFERCGVVGERTNKLLSYLAAVSRKLDEPLAVILQSSSAAGKTSLMEAVLAFMPDEERVKYSAMTGQSLFYMNGADLKHKILAIVEEEGAERASYALKLLQSEGELTIASTGKDPQTGRLVTHEYHVEGPVMILLTTTAVEVDEELLNRCIVLSVDEDREQTRAIHRLQRERQTLEGLLARRDREQILAVHRNAQRMLRPVLVANPYARRLTFLDNRTRTRRDHVKYLTLIRSIALLHQYQRPLRTVTHKGQRVEYIEVTLSDIAVANQLAGEVLGRSLDELPPQTRRLLGMLDEMVSDACRRQALERTEYRFTIRDVREATGWSYTQVRVHLDRLVELEYVLVHRGGRGQQFVYELLYDGQGEDGRPFLVGLIDVEALGAEEAGTTTGGLSGSEEENAGGSRGKNGAETASSPPLRAAAAANAESLLPTGDSTRPEIAYPGSGDGAAPYTEPTDPPEDHS